MHWRTPRVWVTKSNLAGAQLCSSQGLPATGTTRSSLRGADKPEDQVNRQFGGATASYLDATQQRRRMHGPDLTLMRSQTRPNGVVDRATTVLGRDRSEAWRWKRNATNQPATRTCGAWAHILALSWELETTRRIYLAQELGGAR